MSSPPSRRAALTSGAAVLATMLVTACTARPRRRVELPVDPDVVLRAAAVAREQALLSAYDGLLASAVPAVLAHLGPLRADHAVHLEALRAAGATVSLPTSVPTSVSPAAPSAARSAADLRVLERAAAGAHADGAVVASRRLAGVLASLAASEASHAVLV